MRQVHPKYDEFVEFEDYLLRLRVILEEFGRLFSLQPCLKILYDRQNHNKLNHGLLGLVNLFLEERWNLSY